MSPSAKRYMAFFDAHVGHGTWTQRQSDDDSYTTEYTCACGATHLRQMEKNLPLREVMTPDERLGLAVQSLTTRVAPHERPGRLARLFRLMGGR